MIFGGLHDGWEERCSTWDEAERMHAKACKIAGIEWTLSPRKKITDVTRALLGPYVGMEFILRNSKLLMMDGNDGKRCVITFVGHDPSSDNVMRGNNEFYFRFCDDILAGAHTHGWWCWDDRCWREE